MKKRYISLLLVLMMLVSLFGGVSAYADEAVVEEPTAAAEAAEQQGDPAAEPETGSEETSEPAEEQSETESEEVTEEASEETTESEEESESSEETSEEASEEETTSEETVEETTEEAESEEETSEEDTAEPSLDGADAPPDDGGSGSVVYTKITSLADAKTYVAVVSGSKAWYMDMNVLGGKDVTVSGDSCEVSKGVSAKVALGANGYTITLDDPPDTPNYLYVSGSAVATSTSNDGYDKWNYVDGKMVYDGTYYLKADFTTVTTDPAEAAQIELYTGDESSMGGGGGSSETTDELAPTIVKQPEGYTRLRVAYDVPSTSAPELSFSVNAELPEGAPEGTTLSYQWTKDGDIIEGATDATYTVNNEAWDWWNIPGVTAFQCVVSWTETTVNEDGTTTETVHTTTSEPAALVVYKRVNPSDIILFSDVHQEPANIAPLLNAYMANNDGALPGLVLATGDYHNGGGVVKEESTINTTLDAIDAMLGGDASPIRTFYLGGNHESSEIMIARNGGTGLIYGDGENDPVYIYTINYDEITTDAATGNYTYADIIPDLEAALDNLAASGVTKPVLIVGHAGLHTLDDSAGSSSYNIDAQDEMVDLLNEYGRDLDLYFFFGHNHSKGESATYWTAGSTINATHTYDGTLAAAYCREMLINFTYGHMGYLNENIGGGQTATVMRVGDAVTLQRVAKGVYGQLVTVDSDANFDVPVVEALEKTYEPGSTLKAVVKGENGGSQGGEEPPAKPEDDANADAPALEGEPPAKPDGEKPASKPESNYNYQWYTASEVDLTVATVAALDGETKDSYKPTTDGYYYCVVTSKTDETLHASTTVAYVGELPEEEEPAETEKPTAGDYVIVIADGESYYALVCDDAGTLSAAAVEVKDGKVVGPVTDNYLWHFDNPEKGSVQNLASELYLTRTSGGGSKFTTTDDTSNSYVSKIVYDNDYHILYSAASGGSTRYFYPAATGGELATKDMSSLGEAGIYLMKVLVESDAEPETEVKVPPTADNGHALAWATAVLTASAALTGLVLGKRKEN